MATRTASARAASGKNDKSRPVRRATAGRAAPVSKKVAVKKAVKSKEAKPAKVKKVKVVRDSFTMPQSDYAMIAAFKEVFLKNGMHVKKSEVLRAGLHALNNLGTVQLKKTFAALESIKTGRPKKS